MGKKTPKAPAAPDYSALAQQQAEINRKAGQVNQTNAAGDSLTYTQNPDGTTNQTASLNPADQARLDQSRGMYGGLMDRIGQNYSQDMDLSGLQGVNYEGMDPTGNSKAIQDATYGLLQPQREQARNQEYQRLKNMGLTEGSEAWNASMRNLSTGDTDAQMRALLAGTTEYGNTFNRNQSMQRNNQGLRELQYGELQDQYQQPANNLANLLRMQPGNPTFNNTPQIAGADMMGAADKQYAAQMNNFNAQQASKNSMLGGLMGLAGTIISSPVGGAIGSGLRGLFSGGGGGGVPSVAGTGFRAPTGLTSNPYSFT